MTAFLVSHNDETGMNKKFLRRILCNTSKRFPFWMYVGDSDKFDLPSEWTSRLFKRTLRSKVQLSETVRIIRPNLKNVYFWRHIAMLCCSSKGRACDVSIKPVNVPLGSLQIVSILFLWFFKIAITSL